MKYCLTLLLIAQFFLAESQIKSNTNQQLVSDFGYGTMIEMKDVNGRPIINKKYDIDIQGSPFLLEDWCDADLKLINGANYYHAKIKLNVENHQLLMMDSMKNTIILNQTIIREINFNLISSSKASGTMLLRNGYPAFNKQDSTTFYEVVTDGKIVFLKHTRKTVAVFKNDVSGEITKEFTAYEDLYIFTNNKLLPLKRNKQFFMNLVNDKKELLANFIEMERINFKKNEDLIKFIKYCNGLI